MADSYFRPLSASLLWLVVENFIPKFCRQRNCQKLGISEWMICPSTTGASVTNYFLFESYSANGFVSVLLKPRDSFVKARAISFFFCLQIKLQKKKEKSRAL